jgi:tetratricopeptide (TPR) repeat protein
MARWFGARQTNACLQDPSARIGYTEPAPFDLETDLMPVPESDGAQRPLLPARVAGALGAIAAELASVGALDRAVPLFERAAAAAARVAPGEERSRMLLSIALGLADAGLADRALAVAALGIEPVDQPLALAGIAKSFAAVGAGERAAAVFEMALKSARAIESEPRRSHALSWIAQRLVPANQADRALEVADSVTEGHVRTDAFVSVAWEFERAGQGDRAVRVLERAEATAATIPGGLQRAGALRSIADGFARLGQRDRARAVLERALEITDRIPGDGARTRRVVHLVSSLARTGEVERALRLAATIPSARWHAHALRHIASHLVEMGQAASAGPVLERAWQGADAVSDASERARALSEVANAYRKAGQAETALAVLERALAALSEIVSGIDRPAALRLCAYGLAALGQRERALDLARSCPDDAERAEALTAIASAFWENGQVEPAGAVLERVQEAVTAIGWPYTRAGNLVSLAEDFRAIEQNGPARDIMEIAAAAAAEIEDDDERVSVLSQLAAQWVALGQFDRAVGIGDALWQHGAVP